MVAATDSVHTTHLAFEIEGVSQALHVARFDGAEGLSELFEFQVTLATDEATAALRDIVGKNAAVTLSGGGHPRKVHGVISRFRQGASGKRHVVYHATLVPAVFPLCHRHDARIFQEKTTPEIVEAVLKGAGVTTDDYRLALEQTYGQRDYCVQYRESDWSFISRLLEEEGIFYFFESTDDATKLVIADGTSAHVAIDAPAKVAFRPPSGALGSIDAVSSLEAVEVMHAGKFTLRDYNFQKPSLSLESTAAGSRHADLEVFDWPGGYAAPADGDRRAQVRTEERQAVGRTIEGQSSCTRFAAGFKFTLQDHPLTDLNVEYLITSIHHEGSQPLMAEAVSSGSHGYSARFSALPASVPFRAPRLTPRPVIHVQTAIVVGPDGEEIHTDEHGRVKVQFHWDRLGEKNEKSSTWIRVSQAWAGAGWGAIALPRVGQEVVVDFLDGDVDRPIVVGRVYHGTNVPPYGLPGDKTKSTMKSMSSPDGDAGNELRFEDKKDSEEVFLHAQKDLLVAVENDRSQTIGNDDALDVTGNRTGSIGGDEKLDVTGDRTVSIGGDEKLDVTGDRTVTVSGDESMTVTGDVTLTMNKGLTQTVTKAASVDLSDDYSVTVGGDATESVTGKKTIEVKGEKFELTCGQSKIKVSADGVEIEAMEVKVKGMTSATLQGEAQVEVKASGQVSIKADGMVTVQASGMVQVKGAMVKVN